MIGNNTTAYQKHPTEEEQRSAQQAYWDRRIKAQSRVDWIGWVTLGFSALATIGVILSFRETRMFDAFPRKVVKDTLYLKLGEDLEGNRLTLTKEDIGGYAD